MAHEKILIADGSGDTRLLSSLRLKAHGYKTVYTADAIETIVMAHQAKPDVILLDLGLPGSSGFLLLERLKATSALASIPVVIVSAEEPKVAQTKALVLGAVAFLHKPVGQKPVSQHTLVKTVEEALAISHHFPPNVV